MEGRLAHGCVCWGHPGGASVARGMGGHAALAFDLVFDLRDGSFPGQSHGGGGRGCPSPGHPGDPGLRGVAKREPGRAPAAGGVRTDGEFRASTRSRISPTWASVSVPRARAATRGEAGGSEVAGPWHVA